MDAPYKLQLDYLEKKYVAIKLREKLQPSLSFCGLPKMNKSHSTICTTYFLYKNAHIIRQKGQGTKVNMKT